MLVMSRSLVGVICMLVGLYPALYAGLFKHTCYVNRWAFESIAHHIFDRRAVCYPTYPGHALSINFDFIKPGDIVFARPLRSFFNQAHNKLKVPIILITSGDYKEKCNDQCMKKFLKSDKIIAWFAVHAQTNIYDKLIPIPLGIDQRTPRLFTHWLSYNKLLTELREVKKTNLLYVNFNTVGMNIRSQLKQYWCDKEQPVCIYSLSNKQHGEYFKEMAQCKFTLCPPGWASDSYRIWEALLVGSIPVVQKSWPALTALYEDLPILMIDDLKAVDEEVLSTAYDSIIAKKNYNMQKLYMDYWIRYIYDVRKEFLKNYDS